MTARETQLVAALEQSERIASQVLETLASITLCRLEAPVAAVTVPAGDVLVLEPARVVGVAEWQLFDTLIAQLREVKDVAADLTRQLTDTEEAGTWLDSAPPSAPTAAIPPPRSPRARSKKPDTTT